MDCTDDVTILNLAPDYDEVLKIFNHYIGNYS